MWDNSDEQCVLRDVLAVNDFDILLSTLLSFTWHFLIKEVLTVISLVLKCSALTLMKQPYLPLIDTQDLCNFDIHIIY